MKTTKKDETQTAQAFHAIFQSLKNRIDEFGLESMEVAGAFLILEGAIFQKTANKAPNTPLEFDVLADGGQTLISPVILDWYMFGDLSLTDERLSQIETAYAFALPNWSKTNPQVADGAVDTLRALNRHYGDVSGPDKWEVMSKRLLNILRTRLGHQHRAVALMLGDMGSHYGALRRFNEANACLKESLTICESDPDLMTTLAPRLLSDSAGIAIVQGQLVMARMHIDQATEILEQSPTMNKLVLLATLVHSASLFQKMKDVDGLAQVSLRAEKLAEEVWEYDPNGALTFSLILIKCNEDLGRVDEAERFVRWLSGRARMLTGEGGVDVLDRLREDLSVAYGSKGLPTDLEGLISRITTRRDGPTYK
jgi:hypothetical protein